MSNNILGQIIAKTILLEPRTMLNISFIEANLHESSKPREDDARTRISKDATFATKSGKKYCHHKLHKLKQQSEGTPHCNVLQPFWARFLNWIPSDIAITGKNIEKHGKAHYFTQMFR